MHIREWQECNTAFGALSIAKTPMPAKESQFRFQSVPQYDSLAKLGCLRPSGGLYVD